jgi:hypothetical protein
MAGRYRHTQIGYVIICALFFSIVLIAYLMSLYRFNFIPFIVMIILAVCLLLFATLTVTIQAEVLEIRFGPGIIRKQFLLRDIASCRIVRNPLYYGWGIHLTPHGWLYNVSGSNAVEIRMKTGKKYRIGTDVPEELERAISRSIQ